MAGIQLQEPVPGAVHDMAGTAPLMTISHIRVRLEMTRPKARVGNDRMRDSVDT